MSIQLLPNIPFIDALGAEEPGLAALEAEPQLLDLLIASARRTYTPLGVRIADRLSRSWSGLSLSPYAWVVHAVAQNMARPGAYLLNYSYEWGCTSGGAEDPALGGATLLRTLDWPFDNLGRAVVVTRFDGGAGEYFNVAWPGFVGVLTGLAPGRFAAAINQPPLPAPGWGAIVGWPLARLNVARSRAIPADHLLRLVFDAARDYDDAVDMIRRTPICLPAIFTLVGPKPGQKIVIERTPFDAFIPDEPAAANHWSATGSPKGKPRNASSGARRDTMLGLLDDAPDWSLDWVRPPILMKDTRVAVMANPATGRLVVQGFEKDGAATEVLRVA